MAPFKMQGTATHPATMLNFLHGVHELLRITYKRDNNAWATMWS